MIGAQTNREKATNKQYNATMDDELGHGSLQRKKAAATLVHQVSTSFQSFGASISPFYVLLRPL